MKHFITLLLSMTLFTVAFFLIMEFFGHKIHAATAPKYLKGGSVTQHLNGKNTTYSSDDIALVNRNNLGRYKKLYFDLLKKRGKSSPIYNIQRVTRTVTVYKANLAFLHLGVGNNGVTIKEQANAIIVEEKKVPILGLTYARHLSDGFYAGMSGFTNEDFTAMVGYSW